jgi:hypothetical protein
MDTLWRLVGIDEDIRKADTVLQAETKHLEGIRKELAKVREHLAKQRALLADLERDRSDKITESKTLSNQIDRSKEKLGKARNEKEVNAVSREIEETRKLLKDSDEIAGRRILDIEASKKNIADSEVQELELSEKESAANTAVSNKFSSLEKDLKSKRAERQTLSQKLPPALLRKYDLIRTKRTHGAALLQAGRCFACNMSVPPQMEQRLMHVDILEQCPSCSRFLLVDINPAT